VRQATEIGPGVWRLGTWGKHPGESMVQSNEQRKAWLLGIGRDNADGHIRVTRGENYRLLGGSEETHEVMQEKAVKFNEKLRERGQHLEDISHDEFRDIAHDIGLTDKHILPPS